MGNKPINSPLDNPPAQRRRRPAGPDGGRCIHILIFRGPHGWRVETIQKDQLPQLRFK